MDDKVKNSISCTNPSPCSLYANNHFGLFNISEDLPAVTPCMFIHLGAVLQGKQHKIISN